MRIFLQGHLEKSLRRSLIEYNPCDIIRRLGELAISQVGFFDIAKRYAGLDAKNDPLVVIDAAVWWGDFGAETSDMCGTLMRSIGLVRAKARIGLKKLACNMRRMTQLERRAAAALPLRSPGERSA
jgi:hypothetical protein